MHYGLNGYVNVIGEKEYKQVKIKRYSGTDKDFLTDARYKGSCIDFMHLLTKLTSNQRLSKII